ncbi:phage tail protein [Streptomyces rimosus]|uniref:phage tail tube protein n=1 Tax=Streptomyces rimosus TaxID=1927 RepID=UPI0031E436A9
MPAWETLKRHQNHLIRKALEGSTFVAPTTSSAIAALTGSDSSLNALPAGYSDVGWMSDDGAQFSSDVDKSDISSWGSVEPTRRDIASDVTTLQVSLQETNKRTIGLYIGADMTAVVPDPSSGEVVVDKPDRPPLRFWRVLTIGVDLADAGEIYIARFLPRASVTDKDDQNYQNGDDEALGWPVTLTAYMDSTLGYSERFYFGGPGWEALLGAMGF